MDVRASSWAMLILLVLSSWCMASIPAQTSPSRMNARTVSDDDWVPPFPSTSAYYCPAMLPPRPVATPLPTLPKSARGKVKVRFVIGIDGRLHKFDILNSAGRAVDVKAVKALQRWRYEPASCNGVPMEAEGSAEFPLK